MKSKRRRHWCMVLLILIMYSFRMISASRVNLEVDEPINYLTSINTHLIGFPAVKEELGQELEPYFSHPPFGSMITAQWFNLVGNDILLARILSVFMSTLALAMLAGFMRTTIGYYAGLFTLLLLGSDCWLIMTNSMFYLENIQLVLLVATARVYWKTLSEVGETQKKAYLCTLTGILVGTVFIYKHIGVYLVLGVITGWFALRKNHQYHWVILSVALLVVTIYSQLMYQRWGNWWWDPTWHQIQRTFGQREARGLNYGIDTMIEVLIERYWIFGVTIVGMSLGALSTVITYAGYVLGKVKLRYATAVIVFWGMGAIIFGGGTALRSPHYFMLWLLPFWTLIAIGLYQLYRKRPWVVIGILVLLVSLNLLTFANRILTPHGDVIADSAQYVTEELPETAIVATEPYIAALFDQKYVRYDQTSLLELLDVGATHLVLYWTTTADIPEEVGGKGLALSYCNPVSEEFSGFKDYAVVCEINRENLKNLINP